MPLEFMEKTVDLGEFQVRMAVGRLENGTLLLVSDVGHRFGTIAVGVPTPFGEASPTATSCLIGTRFQAEVRAMADVTAQRLGGIVVVNLFLSQKHVGEIGSVLSAVRQLVMELEPEEGSSRLQ